LSSFLTEKITDCSCCKLRDNQTFRYHNFKNNKREKIANGEKNTIYFLVNGTVSVNNDDLNDQVVTDGQFFLQPMESTLEIVPLTETEMISFSFDYPNKVCEHHFDKSIITAQSTNKSLCVMTMKFSLRLFMQCMKVNLLEGIHCTNFIDAKTTELYVLLNNYYSIDELAELYSPIYRNTRTFQRFVLNNYRGVKDVEAFAVKAGYSVPTFRRLFKKTFGMPAYKWMLQKKCECIKEELTDKDIPIKSISEKYCFDSLSNFSHFCKSYLGGSPRELRDGVS
jgi:AraC-like DNA-binding protein